MTFNIGILTSCDSERHLSEPIFNELKKLGLEPHFIQITQNQIAESYSDTNACLWGFKYDFILAVGDRVEQIGGVLAAFQSNIPIGHLYSGDLDTGVSDDIHRAAITLYSSIQFCSSESAVINTKEIMRHAGLEPNAHFVGATHFDGKNIEEIKKSIYGLETYKPYILILINSEMLDDDKLLEEVFEKYADIFRINWKRCLPNEFNVIIAKGNNDNEEIETKIFNKINRYQPDGHIIIERNNRTDHKYFLSLIANCNFFITNSSSVTYEAPLLIDSDRIIHIGNRNKNRTPVTANAHDGHASERIAKLIKEFLENKNV